MPESYTIVHNNENATQDLEASVSGSVANDHVIIYTTHFYKVAEIFFTLV